MRRCFLYLIIIGTCFVLSCNWQKKGSGALPMELVQAENIMYENPDSALHILQGMEVPTEEEAHATWALLLTQAKYKCDVELWYDNLEEAYNYFKKENGCMQQKSLVAYHQGIYYRIHEKDMEKALSFYMEANDAMKQTKDYQLGHLINIHICIIYIYQKLYQYAEEYCIKAMDYALLANDYYYISHSYLNMARIYSAQANYKKSVNFYKKALDVANQIKEKERQNLLVSTALTEISNIYVTMKEYDKALIEIKKAMKIDFAKQQLLVAGHLYYKMNQTDSAYFYLEQALTSDNIYTVKTAYQVLYALSKKQKDYERFVDYSWKLRIVTDSIYKLTNNQALIEMQEKYNQQKAINEKNKAERRGLIILCISIGVIGIIVSFYQWKVLRQNKELEDNRKELASLKEQLTENKNKIAQNEERIEMVAQVETVDMTEELKEKEAAIENMKKQNEALKKDNQELSAKIEQREAVLQEKSKDSERLNVLTEKNAYLRKREVFLSNQLLKMDAMVTNLKKEPDSFKEYQWEELKEKTDALFDGYTERLLKKVPTLTTHDIHICCLIKLSFSNTAMADILGISPTSVSRQKQRLKERIVQQVGSLGENVLLDVWLKEF